MIHDLYLISISELPQKNLLKTFDCGIEELNIYLSRYAEKNDKLGIGKTFIALTQTKEIAGYFTIATAQVKFEDLPENAKKHLPKYPIPALRVARLAVNKSFQKNGIGKYLLTQAFIKTVHVADITGLYFIIVDAKESSASFYEQFGFQSFTNKALTYFLPVETIRKAMRLRQN